MRKALIVIGITLASLLILMGGCTVSLRFSKVQTFIIQKVTKRMSEALNADVSIQRFHYRPLNHLSRLMAKLACSTNSNVSCCWSLM